MHPETVDVRELRARVTAALARAGWPDASWLATSPRDPGTALTRAAVADGADFVMCCGGDGTVRAVVTALIPGDVPLGLVPTGTGNLLARNLGIPAALEDAVHVAVAGRDRRIDVGTAAGEVFAVMAGVGMDAAMVGDASPWMKKALGWPAYVVSAARHVRDRPMHVELRVDGEPVLYRRARAVLVGNVGALQAGARLLPAADPGDGLLDLAVVSPRTALGWARVALRVLQADQGDDALLERLQFRHLEIRVDQPTPHELDGDVAHDVRTLVVKVLPQALTIRVPA